MGSTEKQKMNAAKYKEKKKAQEKAGVREGGEVHVIEARDMPSAVPPTVYKTIYLVSYLSLERK